MIRINLCRRHRARSPSVLTILTILLFAVILIGCGDDGRAPRKGTPAPARDSSATIPVSSPAPYTGSYATPTPIPNTAANSSNSTNGLTSGQGDLLNQLLSQLGQNGGGTTDLSSLLNGAGGQSGQVSEILSRLQGGAGGGISAGDLQQLQQLLGSGSLGGTSGFQGGGSSSGGHSNGSNSGSGGGGSCSGGGHSGSS